MGLDMEMDFSPNRDNWPTDVKYHWEFFEERDFERLNRKHETAEKEQREFVDLIHPFYGLKENPGYYTIGIRPMFGSGLYNDQKIAVSDSGYWKNNVERFTVWHESSHFLHHLANPKIFEEVKKAKKYTNWTRLIEVVAELGALKYLDFHERLNLEVFEEYEFNLTANRGLSERDMLAIINASMFDKNLLEKIVKSEDWGKAKKLVKTHYRQTRNLANHIFKYGLEKEPKEWHNILSQLEFSF